MVSDRFLLCTFCGDRVGVYEPIVVTGGGGRATALAHEPELLATRPQVMHERCAEIAAAEATPGTGSAR